jgi:RHS repeat-associated protein
MSMFPHVSSHVLVQVNSSVWRCFWRRAVGEQILWVAALLLGMSPLAQAQTQVRTSSYAYTAQGLLSQETLEPDTPNSCLQSSYTLDSFGNRVGISTSACSGASGAAVASASVARTSTTTYSADGRFAQRNTNALGQFEQQAVDSRFGSLNNLIGPNNLATSWQYDSFGRKTQETRADNTKTTWSYLLCTDTGANCPGAIGGVSPVWVSVEQSYTTTLGTNAPEKRQYFDGFDRVIRVQTQGFDGAGGAAPTLVQDTEYNTLGQVARQSNLYASTDTPVWTSYSYDLLGRLLTESHPEKQGSTAVMATSSYSYSALSTIATNAQGQTKTTVKNAQGKVASVTDALGSSVLYTYDAVGNLTQTNAAGSITRISYDLRGNKVAMQDPAMGSWTYGYNVFGELVSQRDSLNQTTTLAYDALGRMVQRSEPDLVSQWSFDTKFNGTACGKSAGKLCEAKSDNGYNRTHSYDSLGRASSTATVLDSVTTPAVVTETFDATTGRVSTKTWPTGYQASYSYTPLGYLKTVTGGGTNGFTQTVSYTVDKMNAQGQVTEYRTGNQVTTVRDYDLQTQRLNALRATRDGQANGNVLSHDYSYDALGNLLGRSDTAPGVGTQETFSYDALNRLTTASLLGGAVSPNLTQVMYDARGNISYKSDVGRYWYDADRPNRMTNVTLETAPGATVALTGTRALSYAFDDTKSGAQTLNSVTVGNGNLEYTVSQDTAHGVHNVRWESYTSFNMAQSITYGNFTSTTPALTCPGTDTLTGTNCVHTSVQTTPATTNYSCPVGQTLQGTNCIATLNSAATPVYGCTSGYTLNGANCNKTQVVSANASYFCRAGGYQVGGQCAYGSEYNGEVSGWQNYISQIVPEPIQSCTGDNSGHKAPTCYTARAVTYSCPSGQTLSGSTCSYPVTVAASLTGYSCPANAVVSGSNCIATVTTAATGTFVCSAGQTVNGANCDQIVTTTTPATSSGGSNAPSTTCLPGYTLQSGVCVQTSVQVTPATVNYSCANGSALSGANCVTSSNAAATPVYACPSGYTLSGGSCSKVQTNAANYSYSCRTFYDGGDSGIGSQLVNYQGNAACAYTGYVNSSSGFVNMIRLGSPTESYLGQSGSNETSHYASITVYFTPVITYSCNSGQTLSGSTCSSTDTVAASVIDYTCPANTTLSGSVCVTTSTAAATPVYSCYAGQTLAGTNCEQTLTKTAAPGSTSTSCLPGYTLSGDSCVQVAVTVNPANIGYSCTAGDALSGSSCIKTTSAAASPAYQCEAGYTLNGTSCTKTVTLAANVAYSCYPSVSFGDGGIYSQLTNYYGSTACSYSTYTNSSNYFGPSTYTGETLLGQTWGGYGSHYGDAVGYYTPLVTYSCPSGQTLSGSTCSYPVTVAATIGSYTCPANTALSGTNCITTTSSNAAITYSCIGGQTLQGRSCEQSTTLTAAPGLPSSADRTLSFLYGPEHQRIKQNVDLTGNGTSSYFSGNTWYLNGEDSLGLSFEKEVRSNGTTEYKHYVNAGGMVFALFTSRSGTLNGLPATSTSYFYKDQLGSIAVIADETGAVTERLAYDPWGKRRYINTTPGLPDTLDAIVGVNTDRGYTEHEHLDEVGIIHMNGRIYDPLMGRFMSADPIIQAPDNLMSFNRYSYVWNNPLNMTDPTGYNAYHDSASGAGYGSSNGANDPKGIGGVSSGSTGWQLGGNTNSLIPSYVVEKGPPRTPNPDPNSTPVDWAKAGSATVGILGNFGGVVAGGAMLGAPTGFTQVIGGYLVVDATYGLVASTADLATAFGWRKKPVPESRNSLLRFVASTIAPDNDSAQRAADAVSLTTALVGSKLVVTPLMFSTSSASAAKNWSNAEFTTRSITATSNWAPAAQWGVSAYSLVQAYGAIVPAAEVIQQK